MWCVWCTSVGGWSCFIFFLHGGAGLLAARQSELEDKSHGLAHLLALALNGRRETEGEEVVVLTQVRVDRSTVILVLANSKLMSVFLFSIFL